MLLPASLRVEPSGRFVLLSEPPMGLSSREPPEPGADVVAAKGEVGRVAEYWIVEVQDARAVYGFCPYGQTGDVGVMVDQMFWHRVLLPVEIVLKDDRCAIVDESAGVAVEVCRETLPFYCHLHRTGLCWLTSWTLAPELWALSLANFCQSPRQISPTWRLADHPEVAAGPVQDGV